MSVSLASTPTVSPTPTPTVPTSISNYQPALAFNITPGTTRTVQEIHIQVPDLISIWLSGRKDASLATGSGVTIKYDKLVDSCFESTTQLLVLGKGTLVKNLTSMDAPRVRGWMSCLMLAYADSQQASPAIHVLDHVHDITEPGTMELYVHKKVWKAYSGPVRFPKPIFVRLDVDPRNSSSRVREDNSDGELMVFLNRDLKFDDGSRALLTKYSDRIVSAFRQFDATHTCAVTKREVCSPAVSGWTYPGKINLEPDCQLKPDAPALLPIRITKREYKYVQGKDDHKFKASNGIKIRCDDGYTPGFEIPNDDTLYVDDVVMNTDWIPERGKKAYRTKMDRVQAAVMELKARVVQKKGPESSTSPMSVRITQGEYEYVRDHADGEFKASNGIKIRCSDSCNAGFNIPGPERLWVNRDVIDRDWIPSGNSYSDAATRVQAALEELRAKIAKKLAPTPTVAVSSSAPVASPSLLPIRISKREYEYVRDRTHGAEFTASNGMNINCRDCYRPAFGDRLWVNEDVIDRDWIPSDSEYTSAVPRVQAALEELRAKVVKELGPVPVAAPSVCFSGPTVAPEVRQKFIESLERLEAMGIRRSDAIQLLVAAGGDLVKAMETFIGQ